MITPPPDMKYVGAHVSIEGGIHYAPIRAREIGAKSFALFTKNASRWKAKPISDKDAEQFRSNCIECGYTPDYILPHDSFLINLGNPDAENLRKSREAFHDEMERVAQLGLKYLNFHPGSHLNKMEIDKCLDLIAESLNYEFEHDLNTIAVIENTAGQGSNLGHEFEQIARIIDGVENKDRVGVCIDTCHTYSAGYDLRSEEGYDKVWNEFDRIIGLNYLKGMHINDDKRELGSKIDRHESIGLGTLGKDFFSRLMNDPRFDNMPLILETPDMTIWNREIEWLYAQIRN